MRDRKGNMRRIIRKTQHASRADEFTLLVVADIHSGNVHCREDILKAAVKRVLEEEKTYLLLGGDYGEYINLHDPRFTVDDLAGWLLGREELKDIARAETARLLNILKPVSDKILGMIMGNHESKILQHSEVDVYGALIEGLQSKDAHRLDHRGVVDWVFERVTGESKTSRKIRFFITHGSGGGENVEIKVRKLVAQSDGMDVVITCHHHKALIRPFQKIRADGYATVWGISCPSLCPEMRYAEERDYPPEPVGYVELKIVPDKRKIDARLII